MEILLQARANAACQSDDPKAMEFLQALAEETETDDAEVEREERPEIDPAVLLRLRPEIGIGVSTVTVG